MTKTEEKGTAAKDVAMITLISSDNESFEVSEAVARLSTTISNMIDDGCAERGIPLPNVTGSVVSKVLEYCNKLAAAKAIEPSKADDDEAGGSSNNDVAAANEAMRRFEFDEKLMEDVDLSMLLRIVSAADYLNVKELLDHTAQAIADRVNGKAPEEMREIFGIVYDFTPEEEEIRVQNAWAFDNKE